MVTIRIRTTSETFGKTSAEYTSEMRKVLTRIWQDIRDDVPCPVRPSPSAHPQNTGVPWHGFAYVISPEPLR